MPALIVAVLAADPDDGVVLGELAEPQAANF